MPEPTARELQQFYLRLDQIPEVTGAGVGYIGNLSCRVLRPSHHPSGLTTFVVLREQEVSTAPTSTINRAATPPPPNIAIELAGLGLNCVGAVLSTSAFIAEAGAAPVSGGATTLLMGVTQVAAAATIIQCVNSVGRVAAIAEGHDDWITQLDSENWYVWAEEGLDAISLVGAAAAGAATVRTVRAIRGATGKGWGDVLKGLPRAERKRLTKELIRLQKPGISNSAMKAAIRAGEFPARYSAGEITEGLYRQLRDAIAATLSLLSSAASGNLRLLYVSVYQE